MATDPELRYADADDIPRLALLMSIAFMPDPVSRWLFPDPDDRAQRHPLFFRVFLEQAVTYGMVYRTVDYQGVALWLNAGTAEAEPTSEATEEALRLACGPNYHRFQALDERMRAHHPQTPHAYLPFIAVTPEAWGRGIGTSLLRHKLAQLDLAGEPAYLEASSTCSVMLYDRLGFAPMPQAIQLPAGPALYPMWRRARTPASTLAAVTERGAVATTGEDAA